MDLSNYEPGDNVEIVYKDTYREKEHVMQGIVVEDPYQRTTPENVLDVTVETKDGELWAGGNCRVKTSSSTGKTHIWGLDRLIHTDDTMLGPVDSINKID